MSPRLGVQLYTVRDELAHDFAGTIKKIADIGYTGVETAFFDPDDPGVAEAATIFADHGLAVVAAHTQLPLGANADSVIRHAKLLGTDRIVWPGWPEDERYGTRAGTEQLLGEYREAIETAAAEGLRVGFHNHWWELRRTDHGVPLAILAEQLGAEAFFELDFYWSALAGWSTPDAVDTVLRGQFDLVHVKDGPLTTAEAPNVALGDGAMDLAGSLAATEQAEWWVVELDECDTSMLTALQDSYRWLQENGYTPDAS